MALSVGLFTQAVAAELAIAQSKISVDLMSEFETLDASESTLAYIEMQDVDHGEVMREFEKRYPQEYEAYIKAKNSTSTGETSQEENELLQSALEYKRSLYKEFYSSSNKDILNRYYVSQKQVFVSSYAPLAIVETSAQDVLRIARNADIIAVTEYQDLKVVSDSNDITASEADASEWITDEFIDDLILANQITRVDVLKETRPLTGSGIKIGMIEADGVPDISNPYLASANITIDPYCTTADLHATQVAAILVASDGERDYGVVPDAELYCTIGEHMSSYYYGIEWLISKGVQIINASMGFHSSLGTYDECSAWTDHIAAVHDVHFVKSAGNDNETTNNRVTSPGMAYNAITVGRFTADEYDSERMYSLLGSCFVNDLGTAEKPNFVAKGNFDTYIGTSYAAPQVAGIIAMLCCYDGHLLYRQSVVGAILGASAANKVGQVYNGTGGEQFPFPITGCSQLCDRQGAGIVDARWAWGIIANENYWHLKLNGEDFPYEQEITINTNVNTISRVAIFWTKNNTDINHYVGTVWEDNPPLTNLDLYIYDSNGDLITSSTTLYNNMEIVQFFPVDPGIYTVKIVGTTDMMEYIGLALW